jgi:hypothetical protein
MAGARRGHRVSRPGRQVTPDHHSRFCPRIDVLQAVDARHDLAIAIESLIHEPELIARAPDVRAGT